jgi:hypothetical protein
MYCIRQSPGQLGERGNRIGGTDFNLPSFNPKSNADFTALLLGWQKLRSETAHFMNKEPQTQEPTINSCRRRIQ